MPKTKTSIAHCSTSTKPSLNPVLTDAFHQRALAHRGKFEFPQALKDLNAAIGMEPFNPRLLPRSRRCLSGDRRLRRRGGRLPNRDEHRPQQCRSLCDGKPAVLSGTLFAKRANHAASSENETGEFLCDALALSRVCQSKWHTSCRTRTRRTFDRDRPTNAGPRPQSTTTSAKSMTALCAAPRLSSERPENSEQHVSSQFFRRRSQAA